MVVIGGGAIGAELAQAFARFGTRISLVEAAPRVLALEQPESSELVARAMAADGIEVLAGASISSVHHADGRFTVALTDAEGTPVELAADRLLVAAGRRRTSPTSGSRRSARPQGPLGRPTPGCAPATSSGRSATSPARVPSTHMSMYQAAVALADVTDARARMPARPSTTPCRG